MPKIHFSIVSHSCILPSSVFPSRALHISFSSIILSNVISLSPPTSYEFQLGISSSLLSENPTETTSGSSLYPKGPLLHPTVLGIADRKHIYRLCHTFLVLLSWNFNAYYIFRGFSPQLLVFYYAHDISLLEGFCI